MKAGKEKLELLYGFLRFHSKTETEGGYWAFQDKRFIETNTTQFACSKCYRYWDKGEYPHAPPNLNSESVVITKVIPLSETTIHSAGDGSFQSPPECPSDEHDFQLICPQLESYEGLHPLENGDWLTIYSKSGDQTIVWSGIIKLLEYPPFTQEITGMWIHSDQEGVEREIWANWFLEGYPAALVPYKKINAS